ncbi:unnamed protein product [Lota lota]
MKAAVFTLLTCLLVAHLNGQQSRSNKCCCADKGVRSVKTPIQLVEVYPENQFCHRMEILVTSTGSSKKCVDLKSRLGKFLITKWNKTRHGRATQRNTSSCHMTT